MRSEYGMVPQRAHEEIDPTTLEPPEAEHLQTRAGSPAIRVTRTAYSAGDRPIEYAVDLYRGDRARFVIDLRNA
jgi:GntR family transcriptional regulator